MPEAHDPSVEAAGPPGEGAELVPGRAPAGGWGQAVLERTRRRLAGLPRRWLLADLIGIGLLIGVVAFLGPVRAIVVVLFALTCPGLAIVRLLGLNDPLAELTLGIATSVGVAGLIAGGQLYLGAWSPGLTMLFLLAITGGAIAAPPTASRLRAAIQRRSYAANRRG